MFYETKLVNADVK